MEELYYITNGKNYLSINSNQTIAAVNNVDLAKSFTYEKANNFLKNLRSSLKNLGYHMEPVSNINSDKINRASDDALLEIIDVNEVIEAIEKFESVAQIALSSLSVVKLKLSTVDREIEDILHACEFYNYNACDGFKIYKLLHDKRVERRKIKKYITVINYIQKNYGDILLQETFSDMIKRHPDDKYCPRELEELFKKSDICNESDC